MTASLIELDVGKTIRRLEEAVFDLKHGDSKSAQNHLERALLAIVEFHDQRFRRVAYLSDDLREPPGHVVHHVPPYREAPAYER